MPPRSNQDRLSGLWRVLGGLGDLHSFLGQVVAAARDLTGSEAAFAFELDDELHALSLLTASAGIEPSNSVTHIGLDRSTAGRAVVEQRSIAASSTGAHPGNLGPDDLALIPSTRTVLAAPLMVRGKALGALLAVNKDGADYTGEDSAILESLALPAALAIENAALSERMDVNGQAFSDLDRLKTDFIAITSHELRTPLGVILGHATFLRELAGSQYQEQLDVIIRNAARLKDIVESLSSMDTFNTGGSRLRLQTFALQDLIDDVLDSYAETAAQRKVELTAEPGAPDLMVQADRTKLSIALSNLIRNALTFTDEGGHVRVKCEITEGFAKVSVRDDGVGIPAKDLPRVFDRFFQVEAHLTRRHTGMGLGLSVAKAMIEMHGGRIWVESTEGKGSEFSFLLPSKALGTPASQEAPRPG